MHLDLGEEVLGNEYNLNVIDKKLNLNKILPKREKVKFHIYENYNNPKK